MRFKQSLIDNQSIQLNVVSADWKQAIKVGTDMLEKSGAIEPSYYDAIIQSVESLGPYICIAPDFAMPHARPEDGVNRTAFALVTLAQPIDILGEQVKILITLAGTSSEEHIQGLMEITEVLDDEESETGINVERLRGCQSVEEVLDQIDAALDAQ